MSDLITKIYLLLSHLLKQDDPWVLMFTSQYFAIQIYGAKNFREYTVNVYEERCSEKGIICWSSNEKNIREMKYLVLVVLDKTRSNEWTPPKRGVLWTVTKNGIIRHTNENISRRVGTQYFVTFYTTNNEYTIPTRGMNGTEHWSSDSRDIYTPCPFRRQIAVDEHSPTLYYVLQTEVYTFRRNFSSKYWSLTG